MSYLSRLTEWIRNAPRFREQYPGQPRTLQVPMMRAGEKVTHDTALKYSALYAGVGVIAETIGMLPWRVMQTRPDGTRQHLTSGQTHNVLNVAANREVTPGVFRETLIGHAILWGNGYAEIERDMAGRVAGLWLITPDRVEVQRDQQGEIIYEISNARQSNNVVNARDMFHLHGRGFDGLVGYSIVSLAAQSIGLGLAAEQFGADLFANGTVHSGVLEHPAQLGDEGFKNLKESLEQQHSGSGNRYKPLILEEGMKWQQLGIPPQDAQFVESRELQVNDIARWLRLPPHKIGDLRRATFTNIEHQGREFVGEAILPWTTRLEQEANRKLVSAPRAYTKLNVNALMRGDSQSRAEYYTKMAAMGVFSVNEIRALEDMDGIGPDGDKRLVQLNLTTLERVGEEPAVTPEPQEAGRPVRTAHLKLLEDCIARARHKERSRMDRAIDRCKSKQERSEWLNKFLSGSAAEALRGQLTHPCQAYGSLVGASNKAVSDIVSLYVDDHMSAAETDFWIYADFGDWDDDRPIVSAEILMQEIEAMGLMNVGTLQ